MYIFIISVCIGEYNVIQMERWPVHVYRRYLDPDMYSVMEDSSATMRSKKFMKLTKAICGLVSQLLQSRNK